MTCPLIGEIFGVLIFASSVNNSGVHAPVAQINMGVLIFPEVVFTPTTLLFLISQQVTLVFASNLTPIS